MHRIHRIHRLTLTVLAMLALAGVFAADGLAKSSGFSWCC